MSSVLKSDSRTNDCSADVTELGNEFTLSLGGSLRDVRIAWRLAGHPTGPVIAALGGISAGRDVCATSSSDKGWWDRIVGAGCALDTTRYRVLGIDYLGGSGSTTGPQSGVRDFPSVSTYDQAAALAQLLPRIGIGKLQSVVGASYGGMVALAFAERHANLVNTIVAISAAHRPHPMATAWRSVQREILRAFLGHNDPTTGVRLARALAMTTYRSPAEFAERFSGAAVKQDGLFRAPVEDYIYARGQSYAESYRAEAYICLSESIDLHSVNPERISVPTTLVAVREDQLVPIVDMHALNERLAGPHRLVEISSRYGHDAFLKESTTLQRVFAEAL